MSIRELGFRGRFLLLGGVALLGFVLLFVIASNVLDRVMVTGEIYDHVIEDKDLIADVLPPRLYLVESFLLCHRIVGEEDDAVRDEMIALLLESMDRYAERRAHWVATLPEGALKAQLLSRGEEGEAPVQALLRVIKEDFLPAARGGAMAGPEAGDILHQELEPLFRAHRKHVLETVRLANDQVHQDEAQARADVRSGRRTMVVVALVVFGLTLLLGLWIVSSVLRPINKLRTQMSELASGDADLNARIDVDAGAEVGHLAHSFNAFVENIAGLVVAVRKSSLQLTSASNEMAATSREQEGTINSFGSSTSQIAASVQQISATGAELIRTVDDVTSIAEDSSALASTGRGNLETMDETMHQLQESSSSISSKLSVINERAGDITGVVTTITKVADQTNLLSVNAAIEAEKAGEYGRGFLVVAQEIRRLADQTASASLEIEGSVQEMQTSVSAGVMEMDKFADHVRRSVTVVTEVASQLGQIISLVEQLTGRFGSVADGMRSQAQGADQIHEAMSSLNETVQLSVSALREVTGVAEELRNAANVLNAEIGKFRLED